MEIWIIYALMAMVLSGIYVFVQKVFAHRGYSILDVIYLISIGQLIGGLVGWSIEGFPTTDWYSIVYLSSFGGIIYLAVDGLRIKSLSYIDSAIFFPIYKAVGPALVTLIGVFVFLEELSLFEIVGIILGITVPLLLIHSSEKVRQKDLRKGVYYMIAGVLMSVVGVTTAKLAADSSGSAFLYVVISSVVASVVGYTQRVWTRRKYSDDDRLVHAQKNIGVKKLAIGLGIMNAVSIFFLLKSFEGSLSISYTINSFYILIPIILSILIYREHMNTRKAIAIALSLLAIIFFQV